MRSDRKTDDGIKPHHRRRANTGCSRPELGLPLDRRGQPVASLGEGEAARRILVYRKMHFAGVRLLFGEVNAPRWQPSQAEIEAELLELRRLRDVHLDYQRKVGHRPAPAADDLDDQDDD